MSWLTVFLVGAGGAVGAVARYGASRWFARRGAPSFAATLLVNLAGSLAIGLLIGRQAALEHPELYALVGTGFLGGLTTFSTLNVQKAQLARERAGRTLARYAAATYLGGWALTGLGLWLGHLIE